jgi:hypothetical protein
MAAHREDVVRLMRTTLGARVVAMHERQRGFENLPYGRQFSDRFIEELVEDLEAKLLI